MKTRFNPFSATDKRKTQIRERDNFRFSSKVKVGKAEVNFPGKMLSKSCREAQSPSKSNMAGRSSVSSSSRAGSRRESFDTSQAESLASNEEFMQLLRRLPDELIRLDREIRKLRREVNAPANASHSRYTFNMSTTLISYFKLSAI